MSEQLIAARAAIAELIAAHQAHIDRARAALAALDGDVVPMVRPAPTPDVIDAPVTLPKLPQREQRPAATKTAPGQSKYDYAEVAEVARQAREAGRAMGPAVAARFGITANNADQLIAKARKSGHAIPAGDTGARADAVRAIANHEAEVERAATQDVFKCATCSAVFRERPKLANHTITNHGRGPTSAENTPLADEAAA